MTKDKAQPFEYYGKKALAGPSKRECLILSQRFMGSKKDEYYLVYYPDRNDVQHVKADQIKLAENNMEKEDNEIYPWDVFKVADRIDMDYVDSFDDYNQIPDSKEDLILYIQKYHTALNRAEEIMKRSLGLIEPQGRPVANKTAPSIKKKVEEVEEPIPVKAGKGFRQQITEEMLDEMYNVKAGYCIKTSSGTEPF